MTTEELMEELRGRFESFIFIGTNDVGVYRDWEGKDPLQMIGLASNMQAVLNDQYNFLQAKLQQEMEDDPWKFQGDHDDDV